jgi:integrase
LQLFWRNIKEVCEKAKIAGVFNKRITKGGKKIRTSNQRWKAVSSHCGRRTFATIQVLASTPINLIMLMTGHKTLASFDKYIHLRELQGKQALKDLKWFK